MKKQMRMSVAAMLMTGTLAMAAQQSQTDLVKVAPGQKKTTVIHRKNGATDTVVSEGVSRGARPRKVTGHKAAVKRAPVESELAREIRELRETQAAQQAQIDQLTQANAAKDAALAQAQQSAAAAQTQAQTAATQAKTVQTTVDANTEAVDTLKSKVSDLQTTSTGLATTISENKVELAEKIESPTVLHYKGVAITPVAFFALEGVYRQRSINSDINTPFNTIPYMGATDAHVSELNFSGRQSRLGALFEGNAGKYKLAGYFEGDFLGAGTTSNGNQSNSFVFRQRQFWGQAATRSGFTLTGGQMWSLVTETGKSTDNRTEKLPNTVDPQYMVGFNWARQPAIRLQQKFSSADDKSAFTLAMSLEEAQLTNVGSTANAPTNTFFNGPGQNGGLFNAYNGTPTNNVAPDVMLKVAIDVPHAHFEAGGLARFMRTRYYPQLGVPGTGYVGVAGATGTNDTKLAGGVYGSARVSPSKFLDVAVQAMAGDGVGRYGSAQLTDATFHTNGTLEPVRNYHGLFSLEGHATPKLDVYAYFGGEYAQRTVYATGVAASPFTGYGFVTANLTGCNTEVASATGSVTPAGTCQAATRDILEGMAGFTYRIVSSAKYGRLQYQMNYQYLTKSAWTGFTAGTVTAPTAFGSPKAVDNMGLFGMRYYIP